MPAGPLCRSRCSGATPGPVSRTSPVRKLSTAAKIASGSYSPPLSVRSIGVGRAALPQPDFARQLQEHGRLERKRVCRTFSYCTAMMRAKHNELGQFATGCPPFDKEVYGPIWDEARRQREE